MKIVFKKDENMIILESGGQSELETLNDNKIDINEGKIENLYPFFVKIAEYSFVKQIKIELEVDNESFAELNEQYSGFVETVINPFVEQINNIKIESCREDANE